MSDNSVQCAARLVAITAEHMDTLITDWFPGLDALTVQGYRLVTRVIPCPKCIKVACGISEEESEEVDGATPPPLVVSGPDSAINLSTTDGSSASASPWPSPVHGVKKPDVQTVNGQGLASLFLRRVNYRCHPEKPPEVIGRNFPLSFKRHPKNSIKICSMRFRCVSRAEFSKGSALFVSDQCS